MKNICAEEAKIRKILPRFFTSRPSLTWRCKILTNHLYFFLSEAQLGILRTLPELVELTHQYSEPGTYKLSVSVNSLVGPSTSVQQSVIIGEAPCVIDSLTMLGAGESSDQCPEIQQEYEYSLYTSLKINCQAFKELKYDWKVENVLNGSITEVTTFPKEILSSNVLFLAVRSLRGGLYKFTVSATAIPLGISKVATGFLRVRIPKLLAVIDCGSERVMSWNHQIILNASSSHDPNDIDVSKADESLSFEWFCDVNRSVSCFKSLINNNKSALIFPSKFLDVNVSYEFFVEVTKGMRKAQASQIIKVMERNFPPLCVRLVTVNINESYIMIQFKTRGFAELQNLIKANKKVEDEYCYHPFLLKMAQGLRQSP